MSQIDFLDRVTLAPLHEPHEIRCDTDGCSAVIRVPHRITEDQAATIARAIGWAAQMGTFRWSHHCERHAEVKR